MGLNVDRMKERQEQRPFSDSKFFTLKDGMNVVRILPRSMKYFAPEGDDDFAYSYWAHYGMFDVDGYRMIVCARTVGQRCPICDYLRAHKDLGTRMKASERFLYNIFDYDDGSIKVMETGPFIYDKIYRLVLNPMYGDLFGIRDGRDVSIEKIPGEKSSTGWVQYSVLPVPDKKDISDLLPDGWEEEIDRLETFVPPFLGVEKLTELVKLFDEGKSPKPTSESMSEGVKNGGAKREEQKRVKKVPICFGQYDENDESCKNCEVRDDCSKSKSDQEGEQNYPECYGKDFSPKFDKCRNCPVRNECRKKFFEV